jgi:hypothetical protein
VSIWAVLVSDQPSARSANLAFSENHTVINMGSHPTSPD